MALGASGRERLVNGRTAASEEKRIDLFEEFAWFGDIMNYRGTARRDRAPFGFWQIGCDS